MQSEIHNQIAIGRNLLNLQKELSSCAKSSKIPITWSLTSAPYSQYSKTHKSEDNHQKERITKACKEFEKMLKDSIERNFHIENELEVLETQITEHNNLSPPMPSQNIEALSGTNISSVKFNCTFLYKN